MDKVKKSRSFEWKMQNQVFEMEIAVHPVIADVEFLVEFFIALHGGYEWVSEWTRYRIRYFLHQNVTHNPQPDNGSRILSKPSRRFI